MSKINRNEIFDKNINFLIGAGASFGLLPTLSLALKDSQTGRGISLEDLATRFEDNDLIQALLFSWYVKEIIGPATKFDISSVQPATVQEKVVINYERFLTTVLTMIGRKSTQKKANIFTTNYDGLIAHVAEKMSRDNGANFILNDGGSGFIKRTLAAKNFSRFYRDQGVFDKHSTDIAQINLLQIHGSVYWYKEDDTIEIAYDQEQAESRIIGVPLVENDGFTELLADDTKNENDIEGYTCEHNNDDLSNFWAAYQKLPIVNPTKWKFHETVFEEHYYQMLRLLSYELEKPDTVFITFGFSFADEHILNLVKRSLSNPSLKMFICCFNDPEMEQMKEKFRGFLNIEFVRVDGVLSFSAFNEEVFSASNNSTEADQ